ncbi:hypothetical protein, partial [Alteribacillus sp. HJP-4]|uniref:hypothetical protein n=1 Tax=Alteribacillus sp. HJP-4 TaxID=2775394 RepID=UPI0035CD0D68
MHMTRNSYPFLFLDNSSIKDKGACVFFMRDNCFKTPTFIVEPNFSTCAHSADQTKRKKTTAFHENAAVLLILCINL